MQVGLTATPHSPRVGSMGFFIALVVGFFVLMSPVLAQRTARSASTSKPSRPVIDASKPSSGHRLEIFDAKEHPRTTEELFRNSESGRVSADLTSEQQQYFHEIQALVKRYRQILRSDLSSFRDTFSGRQNRIIEPLPAPSPGTRLRMPIDEMFKNYDPRDGYELKKRGTFFHVVAQPMPRSSEVLGLGVSLYNRGLFTAAKDMFQLELSRYFLDLALAKAEWQRRHRAPPKEDEIGRPASTRTGVIAFHWLQRTAARSAAAEMGPNVVVVQRLSGTLKPLPDKPSDPKASTQVFHFSNAAGSIDFELGVRSRAELLSKIATVGGPRLHEFAGTIVISHEAAASGADFRVAFPKGFVVFDPSLADAVNGMKKLAGSTPTSAGNSSVAILLPRDDQQQRLMGLEAWGPSLRVDAWQETTAWTKRTRWGAIVTWKSNGLRPLRWIRDFWNAGTERENLVKALENSEHVLILFAHGTRAWIALPDGTKLTVEEVRALNLKHQPLVLLLSCEGAQPAPSEASISFAEALKVAGAAAVYGAEQKLFVRDALAIAEQFATERARGGVSLLEILRRVDTRQREVGATNLRLKVEP